MIFFLGGSYGMIMLQRRDTRSRVFTLRLRREGIAKKREEIRRFMPCSVGEAWRRLEAIEESSRGDRNSL